MSTPYIYLGDKQTAGKSSLAVALDEVIAEFCITEMDINKAIEILNDNCISFEE
jgi:chloramphenicol 3-O-phosphotransferase